MQSELVLAAINTDIASVDRQNVLISGTSEPMEQQGCEALLSQPTVSTVVEGDNDMGTGEVQDAEKSGVDNAEVNSTQLSAAVSQQLTSVDVSEQLSSLQDAVRSLRASNDELRLVIGDGMNKVRELEEICTKSSARNKELEAELMQLRGSNERTVGDIALLSTSITQILTRIDRQDEVKATSSASDNTEAAEEADVSSLQPTIDQRVSELELKLEQSSTRFGEFATALDSIERDLQRYIRRHSLVVENLCPKEDRSASDAFLVFVNSVLGVAVEDCDIDGLHLLDRATEDGVTPTRTNGPDKKKDFRPRPILITFTCYRTRTQVYKAWLCHRVGAAGGGKAAAGSLSGERGHGVCIREYLTPSQELVYRKADETRHQRPDVIRDCWTFRGRTFVRTSQDEVHEFNDTDQFCPKETKTSSCVVM